MRRQWKAIAAGIAIWMSVSVAAWAQYHSDPGYGDGYYHDRGGDRDDGYDHDRDNGYRYNDYGYNNRGGYYPDYLRQASQVGYHDGIRNGEHDRRSGRRFRPTHGEDYEHATRGYDSGFRDKNGYRNAYRDGYQRGYARGYNEGYRW